MSKVKVAFLGTGGIAPKHSRAANKRDDVEVVGLSDIDPARVNAFSEKEFGESSFDPKVYTDAAAMYGETQPDAVVICTPHTLHYEQSLQALAAGCHILMEKPMVTSLAHAIEIERKVKELGKVFCVAA